MKPKRVKINVTKSCIENGKKGVSRSCPIALALMKKHLPRVEVNNKYIFVELDGFWEMIAIPKKAQRFILRFDLGEPVKPFSFMMRR